MKKFPLVRLKQFWYHPPYVWFWLRRLFIYKRASYQYIPQIQQLSQMSPAETLEDIIANRRSIIRFGDGEFGLLSGAGIYPPDSDWSQRYSVGLRDEMVQQLQLRNPQILLAIPPLTHLSYREGDTPDLDVISTMHAETRMYLADYGDSTYCYGDWSVFMPQHNTNLDWKIIKNYLQNKTVVVVSGGTQRLQDIQLGKKTFFVEAGKHDAFERRADILAAVDSLIADEKLNPEQTLFWVSLGCTAGCIVEHLTEKGYVAWDTGHIFRFASKELAELSYE